MASSRYGEAIYGQDVYGEEDSGLPHLRWSFEVDWDNDGIFNGENEALYASSLSLRRGREFLVSARGDGFEHVDVGEFSIVLENFDGRFSPRNPASPLYPNIIPLRRCRLTVNDTADNKYYVMVGIITDIKPLNERGASRVRIVVRDGMQWLRDRPAHASLQQNWTTNQAISAFIASAAFPWATDVEESTSVIRFWWGTDASAERQIAELADSELGTFFIAADGTARFYTRHHAYDVAQSLTGDNISNQIETSQPWEVVRNVIQVVSHPKVLAATGDIWRLQDVFSLVAGDTVTIWGNYGYLGEACPAVNVIAPVATTDYLANSSADGTGTNLTSLLGVTATIFGSAAKFEIKNNSGSTAYITLLKIRGDAVYTPDSVVATSSNTASQALYGERALTIDLPWLQNTNTAIDFAGYLNASFSTPKDNVRVIIVNEPSVQFGADLFDKVTLDLPELQLNSDYRIIQINHEWADKTGTICRTEWLLEPYIDAGADYWTFPTELGTKSAFAY